MPFDGTTIFVKLAELSTAAAKPLADAAAAAVQRDAAAAPDAAVSENPADMLNNLALDPDLEQGLSPALVQMGFTIQAIEILDQFTNSRTVTKINSQEYSFYVICIPKSILEYAKPANLGAISLLGFLFAKSSVVYIISRDLAVMDLGFEPMIDDWSETRSVKAVFVPWPHVTKFLSEKSDPKKLQLIKTMLKLDKLPRISAAPASAATALSEKEKQAVENILLQKAKGNPFQSSNDYLQGLVDAAHLPNPALFKNHWDGDPVHDVSMLMKSLENPKEFPIDHARAGELKLGWLIKALLDQELSPDDSKTLLKMILDHHLIRDAETLTALQTKYAGAERV
jgi:hypothetical protein